MKSICYNDLPPKTKAAADKIRAMIMALDDEKPVGLGRSGSNPCFGLMVYLGFIEDACYVANVFYIDEWLRTIDAFDLLSEEINYELMPYMFSE